MPKLDRQSLMATGGRLAAPIVALAYRGHRFERPEVGANPFRTDIYKCTKPA